MTPEQQKSLDSVLRDISPDSLERDDRLIDLMAETVDYARTAHHIVAELANWSLMAPGGSSTYATVHVPSEMWSKLHEFAKRAAPSLTQVKP